MRRILLLALSVAVSACSTSPQTGIFLRGVFQMPGGGIAEERRATEMRYLLRLPDRRVEGASWPLVVYLHGSGDDDYDSRWLTGYGLPAAVEFGTVPDSVEEFVLLAPQAAPGTSWDTGRQLDIVIRLIEEVVSEHQLDPERVAVTGMSMGGYATWHLVSRFPEQFSAAASVSGSGFGTAALPDDLDVCAIANVPFRGYHGRDDMISILDLNRQLIESWEARCDSSFDLRVLDGVGHFRTAEVVYSDPDFYSWLLRD